MKRCMRAYVITSTILATLYTKTSDLRYLFMKEYRQLDKVILNVRFDVLYGWECYADSHALPLNRTNYIEQKIRCYKVL